MKNQKKLVDLIFGIVILFATISILKVACD